MRSSRAAESRVVPDITHDDAAVRRLLSGHPRIAMVGASDNPARDSHRVFGYLVQHGYAVLPVNPTTPTVQGVPTAPDLKAAAAQGPIDIVDVFRAADQVGPVVDEAIAVKAKALWFQFGVVNPPAIAKALQAGLTVVVDRCIKVEHARLL
jgi:predicted CoA-binding protein